VKLDTLDPPATSMLDRTQPPHFSIAAAESGSHLYRYGHPIARGGRWSPMGKKSSSNALAPLNGQNGHSDPLVHTVGSRLLRYCLPILLAVSSAVATGVAAVNHGPRRVYWSIVVVAAVAGTAAVNVIKEYRAASARTTVDEVKAELSTALANIALPLVTALGNVTFAESVDDAASALRVLVDRSVSLAQEQLGHQGSDKCQVRATFYEFDGPDKLVRREKRTSAGARLPRVDFLQGRSEHDSEVIKFASGEEVRFIRDLETEVPPYFSDAAGRCYKTFISVPVRAGAKSYGLLTADSNIPYSLTDADKGFLILVAGTLAAGLAHLETIRTLTKGP
jgi:hypothetical protein